MEINEVIESKSCVHARGLPSQAFQAVTVSLPLQFWNHPTIRQCSGKHGDDVPTQEVQKGRKTAAAERGAPQGEEEVATFSRCTQEGPTQGNVL